MVVSLFEMVLRMSFIGSIIIIVVLIARAMLFKAPKIFSYLLWSVVLFKLLCPISFFNNISVLNFINITDKIVEKNTTIQQSIQNTTDIQDNIQQIQSESDSIQDNRHIKNIKISEIRNNNDITIFLLAIVWLIGIICILLHNIKLMLQLRHHLLAVVPINSQVFLTDYITSPFVCGVFNPKIYLPSSLSSSEQKYIILHEQIHIKRKDYLVKLLAFITLSIHWFNPFVWLAFHLFEKDMEMSCDEAVIKKTDIATRAEYSTLLLKLASGKKTFIKPFAAFGENETKSRIKHIVNYKKPTIIITIVAIIIIITTFIFTIGNSPQRNLPNNSINNVKNTEKPKPSKSPYWWREAGLNDNYTQTMDCAFIRKMTDNTFIVDPLEYIEKEDTKRIKELGLDIENDFLDGYYFHNPDKTTTTWKIDENTEYIFLDWGQDFTNDENVIEIYGYMATYTKDKELFRRYLATYKNSKPKMPFFFTVENSVVKKIVERFFA